MGLAESIGHGIGLNATLSVYVDTITYMWVRFYTLHSSADTVANTSADTVTKTSSQNVLFLERRAPVLRTGHGIGRMMFKCLEVGMWR